MVDSLCSPLSELSLGAKTRSADRLLELLDCLADLRVELGRQGKRIATELDQEDSRVRDVVQRFGLVEKSVGALGLEAATVHQLAQHLRVL